MKRKLGMTLMLLGMAFLMGAAGLLIHNHVQDLRAGAAAEQMVLQMEQQLSAHPAPAPGGAAATEMTIAEIDGHPCVGMLSIPSIERLLPVLAQLDGENLKTGPCRYAGSSKTNDLVVAAHNYRRHFGRLDNLSPGDEVLLTDMDGQTIRYEVLDTEILDATDVEHMVDGSADLTLFTCTYSGEDRITVRCDRVL